MFFTYFGNYSEIITYFGFFGSFGMFYVVMTFESNEYSKSYGDNHHNGHSNSKLFGRFYETSFQFCHLQHVSDQIFRKPTE